MIASARRGPHCAIRRLERNGAEIVTTGGAFRMARHRRRSSVAQGHRPHSVSQAAKRLPQLAPRCAGHTTSSSGSVSRPYQSMALHESRSRLRHDPIDDLRGRRDIVKQIYAFARPNDAGSKIVRCRSQIGAFLRLPVGCQGLLITVPTGRERIAQCSTRIPCWPRCATASTSANQRFASLRRSIGE